MSSRISASSSPQPLDAPLVRPIERPFDASPTLARHVSYGLRRHAPLVPVKMQMPRASVPAGEPAKSARRSQDKALGAARPPATLSNAEAWLTRLDAQPVGASAERRAAQYASMSLAEVEQSALAALETPQTMWQAMRRQVSCYVRGTSAADETVIALRELCRRGAEARAMSGAPSEA